MTFKRAIPKCTPEQQARQDKCREIGCIACRMEGIDDASMYPEMSVFGPTIHHLTVSGRTISQDHTICLCRWHHQGYLAPTYTTAEMTEEFGPSLAKGSKTFHAHYGDNDYLLTYQNDLIA